MALEQINKDAKELIAMKVIIDDNDDGADGDADGVDDSDDLRVPGDEQELNQRKQECREK